MRKIIIKLFSVILTMFLFNVNPAHAAVEAAQEINASVSDEETQNATPTTGLVENTGPGFQKSKKICAQEMLTELYMNEANPVIKNISIDSSMASIFGASEDAGIRIVSKIGETLNVIGVYSQDPVYFNYSTYSVLNRNLGYCLKDDKLVLTIGNPDESNFDKLQAVYTVAQELRQATNEMTDSDKVSYIHDYICDHLEYGDSSMTNKSLADALCDGTGVCNDYTGLFYLFGSYCGLNVKTVQGYLKDGIQGYHAWNIVEVDGQWKQLDVTWDDTSKSRNYFLLDENAFDGKRFVFEGDFQTVKTLVDGVNW